MAARSGRPAGLPPGARKRRQQGSEFWVVGDRRFVLRDFYHGFLKLPWPVSLLAIAATFFVINLGFALLYYTVGGIDGADGSFIDSLSFSVETMATVGYGAMHPSSGGAHAIMIVESIAGLIVTAITTGLVFSKFSRPTTRIAFSRHAVITNHDGKRSLIFRVGNRRGNVIVDATLHVSVVLTTITEEGETFYRSLDLPLVRDRQVGLTRGWTVFHVIDASSPFYTLRTDEDLRKAEVEIYVSLTGIDDITTQNVHTIHRYEAPEIRLDHRFADTLTVLPDGVTYVIDLHKFDEVLPDATPRASVRAS